MDIWVVSTSLAIVNSAAMGIHAQVFVWTYCSFFSDIYAGVKLLDHVVAMLPSGESARLYSKVAAPLYISPSNVGRVQFLYSMSFQ